ncbi:MAG: hypothetical protein COV67_04290 [Nitrospinae bacterium CG11_big_fil_rev_8_21_14_0_20_56_8]|nr:MAG: hypothetical protein COV67_04290 [Nitrospinae bacterium CG11_big_fil_rev_8_21_14_0_20_56_8]
MTRQTGRTSFLPAFLLLLGLLAGGPIAVPGAEAKSPGAESPVSIESTARPAQGTVGDVITWTITVRHDEDIRLKPPHLDPVPGFETLESGYLPPQTGENKIATVFQVKLFAEKVGSFTLPALPIPFEARGPAGSSGTAPIPGEIHSPEARVEIQSVLRLQGEPQDIRDLKPVVEFGRNWLAYLLLAALAGAVVVAVYRLWKKRSPRGTAESPAPLAAPLSPRERALREIEALKARQWMESGRTQDHFFELSEIFRRYLENQFHFPAPEWTTEEISSHFDTWDGIPEEWTKSARGIMSKMDLVKFARVAVDSDEEVLRGLVGFIEGTGAVPGPELDSPVSLPAP